MLARPEPAPASPNERKRALKLVQQVAKRLADRKFLSDRPAELLAADLKVALGPRMGEPLSCERYGPEGDALQQTSTGLARYRKSTNIPTFISVSLLLVGVAFVASILPAYFATKVDPLQMLRDE